MRIRSERMDRILKLRCVGRQIGIGTVPDAISGGMVEKQFNVWTFAHPEPPQPPPNATPRQMARYMAMQPTTAAKVEIRSIDTDTVFEVGKEYMLSITSQEELQDG